MSRYTIKRKDFLPGIVLIAAIILIIWSLISNSNGPKNPFIILGFLAIAIFSSYAILKDERILSVNKVIWYFCLIFMSFSPLCQYVSAYYPWQYPLTDTEIEIAQVFTLLFYFIYYISYNKVATRYRIKRKEKGQESLLTNYLCNRRDFSFSSQLMLFACVILAFVVLVRLTGFANLFIRAENTVEIENSTLRFIVKKFLSAFPAMACTVFIFHKKKAISYIIILITIFIALLSNFPTSTSRYWMATLLLGIVLSQFMKKKESRVIDYGILFSIIVIFPFFFLFKYRSLSDLWTGNYSYKGMISSFNSVDFDAFSLLARSVRYVSDNGVTLGAQLLNIILFFVPRGIWTGKPITTNTLIASSQGASFTNLSCPLPAEGYVNFGVIGIILYAFVLALYAGYLDKLYWEKSMEERNNIITMVYPYLAIIIFYVSRGPLQPSFIQTVAMILPLIVIVAVFSGLGNTNSSVDKE